MLIRQTHLRTLVVAAAATTFAVGAAGAVSATTEPPPDTASSGSEAPPAGGSVAADVSAFCEAELAVEAAMTSQDEAAIGPAVEALTAATPEDIAPTVQEVLANAQNPESPEFAEAYAALVDYLKANCGFAELNVTLSEYAFGGIPEEVPAGPTILTAEAIGEEVHMIAIVRINDDVTLSLDELLALPEEESDAMVTEVGGVFGVFPGTSQSTVLDLTPGRYVAICFFPEGATPEMFEQMMAAEEAAEGSIPTGSMAEGSAPAGSAPMGTEHEDMTTEPATADTATMDTSTGGSAPAEGSAPAGEPKAHYELGMIQEFTVV
jgi:hypothetical protein